jgi:hypothetical protein
VPLLPRIDPRIKLSGDLFEEPRLVRCGGGQALLVFRLDYPVTVPLAIPLHVDLAVEGRLAAAVWTGPENFDSMTEVGERECLYEVLEPRAAEPGEVVRHIVEVSSFRYRY